MTWQEMYLNGQWNLATPSVELVEEVITAVQVLSFQRLTVSTTIRPVVLAAQGSASLYICRTELWENQKLNGLSVKMSVKI